MSRPTGPRGLDEAILRGVPSRFVPPSERGRLQRALQAFDNLGRLDPETGEVSIHEPALRALLRGRELFPASLEEHFMSGIGEDDRRFLTTSEAGKRRISWLEVAERVDAVQPALDATFEGLGLDESSTRQDMEQALRRRHPNLPDEAFDDEEMRARFREILEGRPGGNPIDIAGWWSCLWRNLGFWGVVAAMGLLVAAAACLGATVAWLVCFAIVGGAWVGTTALFWAISCAMNPYR